MRKKVASILMGVFIIFIGLLFLARAFGFIENFTFNGWWTLFIIIPSVYSIISVGVKWHNVFMFCLGVLFLLKANGFIEDVNIGYLILAFVAISIGINFLTGDSSNYDSFTKNKSFSKSKMTNDDYLNVTAIFSSSDKKYLSSSFKGGGITTIFGGAEIDLSEVVINESITIDVAAIFGGIDLKLPKGYRIKEDVANIFGGTDVHYDKNKNVTEVYSNEDIYIAIKGAAIFGGVDIYQ